MACFRLGGPGLFPQWGEQSLHTRQALDSRCGPALERRLIQGSSFAPGPTREAGEHLEDGDILVHAVSVGYTLRRGDRKMLHVGDERS